MPDTPSLSALADARALYERGDFAAARAALRVLLDAQPQSVPVLTLLAVCQGASGDLAAMQRTAGRAVALAPYVAVSRRLLVHAQLGEQHYEAARQGAGQLIA